MGRGLMNGAEPGVAARQREEWLATLSSNTIGVAFPSRASYKKSLLDCEVSTGPL
jgi:hypothetical protein